MFKKIIALYFIILAMHTMAMAQQNQSAFQKQLERMLEEKLRIKDKQLLKEMVTAYYSKPINQTATPSTTMQSTNPQDRNAEVIVHGGADIESEVHAAINPTDTANIIAGSILTDENDPDNPLIVPIYYTTNFASTWSTATFNSNPNAELVAGGGDPVFAFDKDGKAYISWLLLSVTPTFDFQISLYLASSTNKGATWTFNTTPIDVGVASLFTGEGELVDKQWMAVDQNPTSNHEGKLYTVYVSLNLLTEAAEINLKSKAKTATTFSPRVKVHQGTYTFMQFSSIDVAKNGDVHVLFTAGNDENDVALYHAKSTNGGITFAPETKISDIVFNTLFEDDPMAEIQGIEATRLYPCPHIKTGLQTGEVFTTWTSKGINTAGTTGYDIYFAKSTNSGTTWTTAKRIGNTAQDISHQYYSAMSVSPSGKICVTYYDRTDDLNGTNTHYNMTVSGDNGATFSPGVHVTSTPSDFLEIGMQNGEFGIGEYTQVVTTGSYAIPVWSDGRNGGGDIDVYASTVNITGAVSVEDVTTVTQAFLMQVANPATTAIQVTAQLFEASKLKWQVYDNAGKLLHNTSTTPTLPPGLYSETFKVAQAGVYYVCLTTDHGKNSKKVVVPQ